MDLQSLSVPEFTENEATNLEVLCEQASFLAEAYSSYASAIQAFLNLREVLPKSPQSESNRLSYLVAYLEVEMRRQAIIDTRSGIDSEALNLRLP